MMEVDITLLYKKINELKCNYELAKQSRVELVKNMEELDQKLSELEDELKYVESNLINEHTNKIKIIKIIKSCLTRIILSFSISFIIVAAFDIFFFKDISNLPFQSILMLLINTASNITPIFIYRSMFKKTKTRSIEEIEKEYKETLEKRVSVGQKYKKIREDEVLAEKIYKGVEKTFSEQISYMEANNIKYSSAYQINTKDIYSKIIVDPSFIYLKTDEKIAALDEELRKYLFIKISESFYGAVSSEDLKLFTTEELVKILTKQIPENEQQEKLSHIIHAVLNFVGTIQEYNVIWYEENNETLINNPEIIFDEEGRWTELKTHKNTNYQTLFNIVYDIFINIDMKKNKTKKREKE